MDINKLIRSVQVSAVLLIFFGAVVGFSIEVFNMINIKKVELADLLLLFIYVEVMGMIRVYLLQEEIRITYPLIIAITAISRLIILQKKDLDPAILIYESLAILILAFAIIVLRLVLPVALSCTLWSVLMCMSLVPAIPPETAEMITLPPLNGVCDLISVGTECELPPGRKVLS